MSSGSTEVNALNANGFTALDILTRSKRDVKDWEIGELLRGVGAISAKNIQLLRNDVSSIETKSLTSFKDNQTTELKGKDTKTVIREKQNICWKKCKVL